MIPFDVGPDKRFYGIYRGKCMDIADPQNLGRIKLQVPQILGTAVTGWSHSITGVIPAVGDPVWVTFEGGDPNFPLWLPYKGFYLDLAPGVKEFLAAPSSANFATAVTDEVGTGQVVLAQSPLSDFFQTPGAATFFLGVPGFAAGVPEFLQDASSQNLINLVTDETGTGYLVFNTKPELVAPRMKSPVEKVYEQSTAITAEGQSVDIDLENGSFFYLTGAWGYNFDLNIRWNPSTALSSELAMGEAISVGVVCALPSAGTNGPVGIKIDGTSATVKWQGGVAPTTELFSSYSDGNGVIAITLNVVNLSTGIQVLAGSAVPFTSTV